MGSLEQKSKINGYDLSRVWFDWCFDNPGKYSTNHVALYYFTVELCNKLGWPINFQLPTTYAMAAIGLKSYKTYIKTLNDLIDFGFISMIEKSKNQHTANRIELVKNANSTTKADTNSVLKQGHTQYQSTDILNASKTKPLNNETIKPLNHLNSTEEIECSVFIRVSNQTYNSKLSDFFKKNFPDFLEQWLSKNNDAILDEVLEYMDQKYFGYTFTDLNHVQNSFTATWQKIKKEKNGNFQNKSRGQGNYSSNKDEIAALDQLTDQFLRNRQGA